MNNVLLQKLVGELIWREEVTVRMCAEEKRYFFLLSLFQTQWNAGLHFLVKQILFRNDDTSKKAQA